MGSDIDQVPKSSEIDVDYYETAVHEWDPSESQPKRQCVDALRQSPASGASSTALNALLVNLKRFQPPGTFDPWHLPATFRDAKVTGLQLKLPM